MPMLPIFFATLIATVSVFAIVYSVRLYAPAFRTIRLQLANGGAAINYRYAIKTSHVAAAAVPSAIRIGTLPDSRMKRANGLRYSTAVLAKAA